MSTTITSEVIDPSALSPVAKQRLIDELHATHAEIFDGVSKAEFAHYVVDSPAERTRIQVYGDGARVVGYLAVHTFVRVIAGQRWVVLRAESGKLPAYRRGAKASLMIAEVARACLRYPRARKAMLGCFVHPSAYVAMGHVAPEIYPHWHRPTPAPIEAVMNSLAADFGLAEVDSQRLGVRKVGWITRESAADRDSWARRRDAMTRFYLRENPGYREGHGLVVLVSISVAALVEGCLRHVRRVLGRHLVALSRAGTKSRGSMWSSQPEL